MLMTRGLQFRGARASDLGQRVGVVSRHATCDQTRRGSHVDDVASLKVAEHGTYAGDQQRLLADRDRLGCALVDDDFAARRGHVGDPQAARRGPLLRGLEPRADVFARQDGFEGVRTGELNADAARGGQHRGLYLRRHTARAHARARAGHQHAHKVVGAFNALNQLRTGMVRRRGVEAVHVREQHEGVSLNHLGDERGEAIVVAEAQLSGRHRIVFVENRNDAEAEEARQRGAHVRVVVAAHDVVRGQQDLGGVEVMRLEGGRPARHEEALAHRGSGLHARQVLRLRGEAERIKSRCHGAGRHDNDLAVRSSPACNEASHRVDTVQVQTAIVAGQRRRADLDDDARGVRRTAHD